MTYRVFVEQDQDTGFKATAIGWPGTTVAAATRTEALAKLRQTLRERLAVGEIVDLDLSTSQEPSDCPPPGEPSHCPPSGEPHPWLRHTEIFKDNPLFDEVMDEIEIYRRELDAEAEGK